MGGEAGGSAGRWAPLLPLPAQRGARDPRCPPREVRGSQLHQPWPRSALFAGQAAAAVPVSCLPAPRREPSPCCRGLAGSGGLWALHAGGELKAAHTRPGEGEQLPWQQGHRAHATLCLGTRGTELMGCVLVLSPHTILLGTAYATAHSGGSDVFRASRALCQPEIGFCLFTVSSGCFFFKSYLQSKTKVLLPASKAVKPSGVAKP